MGRSTGTRFANEPGDYTSIAKAMPQDQAYAVFDEAVFQSSSAICEYYGLGYITKADTIEELADQIGLDSAVLKDTVDKYTEAAAAGEDAEFGRPLTTRYSPE